METCSYSSRLVVLLYHIGTHNISDRPSGFKELLDVENLQQRDRHKSSSLEERPLDNTLVRALARWRTPMYQ
jgi:hypothetical protein